MTEELYAALKAMEGEESEPRKGNDRVNQAMTRHWCEAMQDANPLYRDEGLARSLGYGGAIAPAAMIQAYCTPVLWPESEAPPDPIFKAVQKCVAAGYSGSLGISIAYEFFQPLYPGDQIVYRIAFLSVSTQKTTRVGAGYFLTSRFSYRNQAGVPVCDQVLTVLQYQPQGEASQQGASQ
ncbi:MAG: MaoC family dehydratase N-terminal domain-containing protein [Chloroflexi bacterium]|nr:MaoC family dehydratase N-terminal domain-containing protein [Chloroflexota bacterium]